MSPSPTSVSNYLDTAPFTGTTRRVPILCCLLMLTEGMDTYGVGYVGPFLTRDYALSPSLLGVIYTGTVIASLLGAVGVAPLSDKFGRRPVLVLSSLLMGLCTLLTPFAANGVALFAVRFLIGLGFGAAVPTAFALTSDYAPTRHRALVTMMMSSGVALGMVLAGFLSAAIIPPFGWRALLYLSGCLSLLWTLVLAAWLPESLRFLASRRSGSAAFRKLIDALAAERREPAPFLVEPVRAKELQPVRALFSEGRAGLTLLLWFAMSATYCAEFFMSYWLPTVLITGGTKIVGAGLVLAIGKIGSILGAIAVGWTMDRGGPARVLSLAFLVAALAIWALGESAGIVVIAAPLVVLTCFFLDGSFAGIQALTAASYPDAMRATGSGWVTGFARLLGGGLGTMSGGWLIEAHWTIPAIASVLALPMLLGSLAMLLIHRRSMRIASDPALLQVQVR